MKKLKHVLTPVNWNLGVWAAICLLGVIMSSYAWVVASPTGASPDDDFHQASIWCPMPVDESCVVGTDAEGDTTILIPETVTFSACYGFHNNTSAACTGQLSDDVMVVTPRFNDGGYPGGYYAFMHMFVEKDVDRTILVMRWVNVCLATVIYGTLFFLAPPSGRRLTAYMLLGTSVPLVTYLATSINPSAWGILGVVSAWLALHLGFSSESRPRRIALFGMSVVGATLAATARADAGSYLVIVACAAVVFNWTAIVHRLKLLIPVPIVAAIGVVGFMSGGQNAALSSGMTGEVADHDPIRVLAYNLFQMPNFIAKFWNFDMGWLDTPVPLTTAVFSAAVTIGLCGFGLSRSRLRLSHALSLIGLAAAIIGVPVAVLQAGLNYYPEVVQIRYIAPLIVVFVGTCLADRNKKPNPLPLAATVCFVFLISVANAYALYTQIQRYVSGLSNSKVLNLSLNIQWWRAGGPSPMYTWLLGSLGFALMSTILFAVRSQRRDAPTPGQEPAPHDQPDMNETVEDRVPQP